MLGTTLLFLAGLSAFPASSAHDRAPPSARNVDIKRPDIVWKLKKAAKRLHEGIKLGPNTAVRVGGKYPVEITHNVGARIIMTAGAGVSLSGSASVGVSIQIRTD